MKQSRTASAVKAPPSPKGGFRQTDQAQIPEEALTFRERKVLAAYLEAVELAAGKDPVRSVRPAVAPGQARA